MALINCRTWIAITGIVLITSGCDGARERARGGYLQAQGRMMAVASRPMSPPSARGYSGGDTRVAELEKAAPLTALADSRPDRYLIRNATLTLEARNVREASVALAATVRTARGYVSDTHETMDELGKRSTTIQVRVPFSQFDRSMQQIEMLGKVLEKQVTAEDVTEEFVDSQAKLRNLKRTELRLLDHLNRTGRLAEVLLVEKELNRVRGEIEQLEGRLRFLEHRVAYSTITATLSEAPRPQQMVPAETYSSGKEAADAMRSLVAFGRVIWTGVIWMGVWAIVWVPLALAGWLVYRRRREVTAR
jgi:hypothetical protein